MPLRTARLVPLLSLSLLLPRAESPERVHVNDNRKPAGTLAHGVLTVHLEVRLGTWYPDGDNAPGAAVPAFAEAGAPPQIPVPLIRVPAGTAVSVTLRNALRGATLVVHGLNAHPPADPAADTLQLAPGATRQTRLRLDTPGTYYYWGTTTGRLLGGRMHEDAQLSGAIVVDEPGRPAPAGRIFVIGMWGDTAGGAPSVQHLFVVNGRSWPHTERLSYAVGDTVRWRVLNVSADIHPMHLHGFYFEVGSRGDGRGDTTYAGTRHELEVTERFAIGQTVQLTWIPDRTGNWLFHCHIPAHFGPRGSLGAPPVAERGPHAAKHALEGMNGLVVGITVRPRAGVAPAAAADHRPRRRLRLLVRENAGGTPAQPYYEFALQEGGAEPPPDSGHHAGPAIVLTRGEPVAITVVNHMAEPTSVHWHGIELESYFDGVAGWSGGASRLAPAIAPGDSFEARFTPPRAGTFMYHTHVDELRQQPAGLAGALLVLEPGARWDPATDVAVLVSSSPDSAQRLRAVFLNGELTPPPLDWRVGVTYRLRFINITMERPGLRLELRRDTTLARWRVVAKDGAPVPAERQVIEPATRPLSIGETLDVALTPSAPGDLRLEARAATGLVLAVLRIRVRE
jgi:manganese oxidase